MNPNLKECGYHFKIETTMVEGMPLGIYIEKKERELRAAKKGRALAVALIRLDRAEGDVMVTMGLDLTCRFCKELSMRFEAQMMGAENTRTSVTKEALDWLLESCPKITRAQEIPNSFHINH